MVSHRHHVVSRGYQRFFAEKEIIRLIDTHSKTYVDAGTRGVFVKRDFNSWHDGTDWNDEVEQQWQRLEGEVLGGVRQLLEGDDREATRDAARVLAALHIARSYSFAATQERILDQVGEHEMGIVETDPFLRALFASETGYEAAPGELAMRVQVALQEMRGTRRHFLEGMARVYDFSLNFFRELNVALLRAPTRMHFLTGDTPVVTLDARGFRVGFRQGVAIGDTAAVFMPLSPNVAMDLHRGEPRLDLTLPPIEVQKLNLIVGRAAVRYLACHPADDPRALLADKSYRSSRLQTMDF